MPSFLAYFLNFTLSLQNNNDTITFEKYEKKKLSRVIIQSFSLVKKSPALPESTNSQQANMCVRADMRIKVDYYKCISVTRSSFLID